MNCHNCARKTLSLFFRSFVSVKSVHSPFQFTSKNIQSLGLFSTARRLDRESQARSKSATFEHTEESTKQRNKERPPWQVQKAALKEKLGGETWNPRKKLSPDAVDGIRHLNASQPEKFTTPVLARHFKISPEAVRRILKGKWRPSDAEYEERLKKWDRRGERIWSNLVEMGVKPPKRWREMGVGRSQNGEKPRWKLRSRNLVEVRDSVSAELQSYMRKDDIIPIVDGHDTSKPPMNIPLSERL